MLIWVFFCMLAAARSIYDQRRAEGATQGQRSAEGKLPAAEPTLKDIAEALEGLKHQVSSMTSTVEVSASAVTALGLKWEKRGDKPPGIGRELTNPKLAFALKRREESPTFTAEDLKAFELESLQPNDFIKSGPSYFQPVVTVTVDGSQRHANGGPREWETSRRV